MNLLEPSQKSFEHNLHYTLTKNNIPCPHCEKYDQWYSQLKQKEKRWYAICLCRNKKDGKRGCGRYISGTTFTIEIYVTRVGSEFTPCAEYEKTYYSFAVKYKENDEVEEWESIQEVKDPGYE